MHAECRHTLRRVYFNTQKSTRWLPQAQSHVLSTGRKKSDAWSSQRLPQGFAPFPEEKPQRLTPTVRLRRADERASLPGLPSPTFTGGRTLASTVTEALGFPEPVKFPHSSCKDLLRACCSPGTVPGAGRAYRNESATVPACQAFSVECIAGVSGRGRVSLLAAPHPLTCNPESLPLPFLIKFKSCEE